MLDDTNQPEQVALALGSNLGDRLAVLRAAVEGLRSLIVIERKSPVYETPAAYVADQPAYLNAVLVGRTELEPLDLLREIKQLETQLGRTESFRYGPRLIDIDIIFYGNRRISESRLHIPHPRLAEREFVLRPLADIAAGWKHPVTGVPVENMLAVLPKQTARRLEDVL